MLALRRGAEGRVPTVRSLHFEQPPVGEWCLSFRLKGRAGMLEPRRSSLSTGCPRPFFFAGDHRRAWFSAHLWSSYPVGSRTASAFFVCWPAYENSCAWAFSGYWREKSF